MRNALKVGLALVALTGMQAMPVLAQTSGSVNATATVLAAITVTGNTGLLYGNVTPTQTKTLALAGGGKYTVTGGNLAQVGLTFTLPTDLGDPAVAIGSWTGGSNVVDNTATSTAFTPSASSTTRVLSATGGLFVYIGATLTTTAAPTGSYTAPVTMTVIYN